MKLIHRNKIFIYFSLLITLILAPHAHLPLPLFFIFTFLLQDGHVTYINLTPPNYGQVLIVLARKTTIIQLIYYNSDCTK